MTDEIVRKNAAPSAEQAYRDYLDNAQHLAETGMYAPDDERDACGVGFVAAIDGKPRRDVVVAAIDALKAVWHRGAVDADGKTGDGAGIYLQIPQDFFLDQLHGDKNVDGSIAVGMVFLPRTDFSAQERCRTIVETEILRFGYSILGWRQVPVDTSGDRRQGNRHQTRNRTDHGQQPARRERFTK